MTAPPKKAIGVYVIICNENATNGDTMILINLQGVPGLAESIFLWGTDY